MIPQRKIAIIVGVAIFSLLTIWIALLLTSNKEDQHINKTTSTPFTIKGLDNPEYLFSNHTQTAITAEINSYLALDDINTNNVKGVVRKDSYTQDIAHDTTVTTLLIDIPTIKRTYKVLSSASGTPDGDNSLYIRCPSESELIYDTFDCKDDTSA